MVFDCGFKLSSVLKVAYCMGICLPLFAHAVVVNPRTSKNPASCLSVYSGVEATSSPRPSTILLQKLRKQNYFGHIRTVLRDGREIVILNGRELAELEPGFEVVHAVWGDSLTIGKHWDYFRNSDEFHTAFNTGWVWSQFGIVIGRGEYRAVESPKRGIGTFKKVETQSNLLEYKNEKGLTVSFSNRNFGSQAAEEILAVYQRFIDIMGDYPVPNFLFVSEAGFFRGNSSGISVPPDAINRNSDRAFSIDAEKAIAHEIGHFLFGRALIGRFNDKKDYFVIEAHEAMANLAMAIYFSRGDASAIPFGRYDDVHNQLFNLERPITPKEFDVLDSGTNGRKYIYTPTMGRLWQSAAATTSPGKLFSVAVEAMTQQLLELQTLVLRGRSEPDLIEKNRMLSERLNVP